MIRATLVLTLAIGCLSTATSASAEPPPDVGHQAAAMIQAGGTGSHPGVVALVARGDKVLFRGASGMSNLELSVPMTPGQRFRIGSVTKTFTAAEILKLETAHRVALGDPLSKYLPDFPNGSHISLRQLLSHTSGVSDNWPADPAKPLGVDQTVKLIAATPPDFPPGQAWSYSNSGYMLLGAVIEKVTGKHWNDAIAHDLLQPLHLTHTGFFPDESVVPSLVSGYSQDSEGAIVRPQFVTITGPATSGALVSNVDDLFHWLRALATNSAIPAPGFDTMSKPSTTDDGKVVGYGLGLMLGTVRGIPVVEHNGGIEGFASHVLYIPSQDVTVVVLANSDAAELTPRGLAHRLGALAIGNPYDDLHEIQASPGQWQALAGIYRSANGVTHTLAISGRSLTIGRDEGPARPLAMAQGDRLFYPSDRTDYIKIVRENGKIVALDFYTDGMPPARRESRVSGR